MKTHNFAAIWETNVVKMTIKLFPAFDCYYLLLNKNLHFCHKLPF